MRKQKKTVTLLYGGISAALIVVVATVALVAAPPAPPSMAEYAPSAIDSIDDAPDNQQSQFGVGDGDGECPVGMVCDLESGEILSEATRVQRRVIDKARVRRCVGDPPRQIEDPQSPPCVNFWEGDNGGATWRGVTRHEIRVDMGRPPGSLDEALIAFFNRRFEFYGRQIVPLNNHQQFYGSGTAESQRAAAESVDERGAFAALELEAAVGSTEPYRRELARRQILSFGSYDSVSSSTYRQLHPYLWLYGPPVDEMFRNLTEFGCKSLVGRSAQYGDPRATLAGNRKFAVAQPRDEGGRGRPDVKPLVQRLQACGAGEIYVYEYSTYVAGPQPGDQVILADMKARGVTTAIVLGHSAGGASLMSMASASDYRPEWLIPGMLLQNWDGWQVAPADQTAGLFGLGTANKTLPPLERPVNWALGEQGYPISGAAGEETYEQLLVLASGIQAAGPNLTPQTFARELQGLRFPNPGAAGPPYFQATVGFSHDHSMIDDIALVWWSSSADSYDAVGPAGSWCYIERGARWSLGRWPSREHSFFDRTQPCR